MHAVTTQVFTIENVKLQRLFKWERKHVAPFLLKDVPNMKTVVRETSSNRILTSSLKSSDAQHIHDSSDLDDPERMREIVSEVSWWVIRFFG